MQISLWTTQVDFCPVITIPKDENNGVGRSAKKMYFAWSLVAEYLEECADIGWSHRKGPKPLLLV